MTANRRPGHRRGRRTAIIATSVAAVTLTAGLLTGCEDTDDALDCLTNADTISDSLKAIEGYNKAILNGDTDPDSSRIDAAADELKDVCTS